MGAGTSGLIALGAVFLARQRLSNAELPAAILGAILLATMICAAARSRKADDFSRPAWVIGVGMTVFTTWLMLGVMVVAKPLVSARGIVSRIPRVPDGNLVEYSLQRPSVMFYSGMRLYHAKDAESAKRLLMGKAPGVVLVKPVDEKSVTVPGSVTMAKAEDFVVLANPAAAGSVRMGQPK